MIVATKDTVYAWSDAGPRPFFSDGRIRAISESGNTVAIVSNGGLTVAEDRTETRLDVPDPELAESLDILDDGRILLGTEGPHIYRYNGSELEQLVSFDTLPCRDDFYTPWGGPAAVRSFAHTQDGHVYADIHVGSIMRSPDGGDSWEPVTPDLHEDVHQVVTRSAEPDTLYANTADAVYISEDRGDSWEHRSRGLPYSYGRAIAAHPADGDCLLATVSRGPHGDADGQLYRSEDRGRSWNHVTTGFPGSSPVNIDTFQIAFTPDGRAWACLDHDLLVSEDRGLTWTSLWTAPAALKMIAS